MINNATIETRLITYSHCCKT